MSNQNPNILTAKDFHDARAEITNQGVKGLLLINGGAAVALLAFLQAIWTQDKTLAKPILVAIAIFAIGVLLAGTINFLRYHTSFSFQSGDTRSYDLFRNMAFVFQYLSLGCFAGGVASVVLGAWSILPCVQ